MPAEDKHPLIGCLDLAIAALRSTSKDKVAKAIASIECAIIIAKHKPVQLPQINSDIPDCYKCSGMAGIKIFCTDCGCDIPMPQKKP